MTTPRFPEVKLPRTTKDHPLVVAVERLMKQHDCSMRRVAMTMFDVTQQTLHEWMLQARHDRDWPVPPRRVLLISKLSGVSPYQFNPALWPDKTWRPK